MSVFKLTGGFDAVMQLSHGTLHFQPTLTSHHHTACLQPARSTWNAKFIFKEALPCINCHLKIWKQAFLRLSKVRFEKRGCIKKTQVMERWFLIFRKLLYQSTGDAVESYEKWQFDYIISPVSLKMNKPTVAAAEVLKRVKRSRLFYAALCASLLTSKWPQEVMQPPTLIDH